MSSLDCSRSNYEALRLSGPDGPLLSHCNDKYQVLNYFGLFHEDNSRTFWLLMLALIVIPLAFGIIKLVADEFLSRSIMRIKNRLGISALMATVTVIPLANGAPDLLISFVSSGQSDGADICIASILGAFVFAWSVVLGYIVKRSGRSELRVPLRPFVKESVFSLLGLNFIIILGLWGGGSRWLALVPLCGFGLYTVASLWLARVDSESSGLAAGDDEEDLPVISPSIHRPLVARLRSHLCRPDASAGDLLGVPARAFLSLCMPAQENPLVESPLRHFVLASAMSCFFLLFEFPMQLPVALALGFGVSVALFPLLRATNDSKRRLFFDILTLAVSVGWMKALSSLLLDSIMFVCFLLGAGERFLMMLILSVGNSISDLFSNGAIAASGGEIMALLGAMSSQVFNMYLGLSLNLFFGVAKSGFDILGIQRSDANLDINIIKILILFSVAAVVMVSLHFLKDHLFTKDFSKIGFGFYGVFIATSSIYTILTSI